LVLIAGGVRLLGTALLALRLILAAFLGGILALWLIAILLAFFRLLLKFLAHIHGTKEVAYGASERILIVDVRQKGVEIGAGLLFDPVPPQFHDPRSALRRTTARQLLAHHECDRFFERRIGAVAHIGKIGPRVLVLEHVGDVVRVALHGPGSDRHD